ncbi:MAG: ribosome maturation factor RimP [Leptospiraceae bacterium]|nr:ribosome maturation factor RimP [Leptospiraceae bacterium]MCP5502839.1 ribosome maturation factor RimP [Leptospiraceae bacterium]
MTINEQEIIDYVNSIISHPIAIYDVKVHARNKRYLIELYLDNFENKYGSVSIGECETVSREFSSLLETEKGELDFVLRVSSAGAERELKIPSDLQRFQGLLVKLKHRNEEGKEMEKVYKILSVNEKEVHLEVFQKGKKKKAEEPIIVNLSDLIKGNLYVSI